MAGTGKVEKLEAEVEIKASADHFHDIFSSRPHHISNICPEKIQGCDIHEGEWGNESSVIYWNYVLDGKACVAKEIVEAIDKEKNSITFKVIEGELLVDYKSFKIIVQATPKGETTLVKWTFEFEKLKEHDPEPKKLLHFVVHVTKDIEDHLERHDKVQPRAPLVLTSGTRVEGVVQVQRERSRRMAAGTGKVEKLEIEVEIKASADHFHDIFSSRPHHISNVCPEKVQSCEIHEGEWGKESSVIYWNYVLDGKACVAKQIVEAIDKEKNSVTFKVIEGQLLEEYKSLKATIQATPKGETTLVKWTLEFEKLKEDDPEPKKLLDFVVLLTKDIEDHLVKA
ncbi:MLP-like protein 34 [Malania oleifera]|uniref:MLP-like protein 34 n=1 Tax=Malania oleifera TaxID=397392 RepID=UPI0025AE4040|nr:MLP-like protein 34 [Malania oleifera]